MGFLTSIFGGGETNLWTIIFAMAIVLVLIAAVAWVFKALFKASGSIARGRQRRLAIIDTMAIDTKRHLILIRRDDVEHLIITGSANDLVVETGIPVPGSEAGAAATAASGKNRSTPLQPASDRTSAAAQRLGLSSILRRKNQRDVSDGPKAGGRPKTRPPGIDKSREPDLSEKTRPLDRLKKPAAAPPEPAGDLREADGEVQEPGEKPEQSPPPSLRHTGLLRPVSEMETPNLGASRDNSEPQNPDSAKNEVPEVDAQAMESVEEGASPDDDGAKVRSLNDNQEAGNKGS